MIKDILIHLLKGVEVEMKRRCEQNTDEMSRDQYGVWHEQIKNMLNTLEKGRIK